LGFGLGGIPAYPSAQIGHCEPAVSDGAFGPTAGSAMESATMLRPAKALRLAADARGERRRTP